MTKIEVIKNEIELLKIKYNNDKMPLKISIIEIDEDSFNDLKIEEIDGIPVIKSIETMQNKALIRNSCKIKCNGVTRYFNLLGIKII